MDIRSLETAIKEALRLDPTQPAFATLSSKGDMRGSLSSELAHAVETLASRKSDLVSKSVFGDILAGWH